MRARQEGCHVKGTIVVFALLAVACQGGGAKTDKAQGKKEDAPATLEAPAEDPVHEPPSEPTGPRRALLVGEDGYWVAIEGQPPKHLPKAASGYDTAALATELDDLQNRHREAQLDLAAEDAVKYQDLITAMDTAVARGMGDVALVNAASLPVVLPPDGSPTPARCNDKASGVARPAGGNAAPIATLPIVVVTKDGSGSFAATDGKKIEFAAPKGCELDIPAVGAALKAAASTGIILQADKDATAAMIHRVVRTADAAGAKDVLFAVKRQ
jgi:biopolymer transport protein ExbD